MQTFKFIASIPQEQVEQIRDLLFLIVNLNETFPGKDIELTFAISTDMHEYNTKFVEYLLKNHELTLESVLISLGDES